MIKYSDLTPELLYSYFPNLTKEIFSEEQSWSQYETIPPHCLYSAVLNPYSKNILSENRIDEILRLFGFYELLASADDFEVVALLQVSLLESIWDRKDILRSAENYMGPYTRKVNNKIATYLKID